jgi:hypothetical protein
MNPRIAILTLKTDNFDMVLIYAYAPTEDKDKRKKSCYMRH